MKQKRTLEVRAADAERKALWLKAKLAAQERPDVMALYLAVRHVDDALGLIAVEGLSTDVLREARRQLAAALVKLSIYIPEE